MLQIKMLLPRHLSRLGKQNARSLWDHADLTLLYSLFAKCAFKCSFHLDIEARSLLLVLSA